MTEPSNPQTGRLPDEAEIEDALHAGSTDAAIDDRVSVMSEHDIERIGGDAAGDPSGAGIDDGGGNDPRDPSLSLDAGGPSTGPATVDGLPAGDQRDPAFLDDLGGMDGGTRDSHEQYEDAGADLPDRWSAAESYGNTAAEQRAGESLDRRLAQEEPER